MSNALPPPSLQLLLIRHAGSSPSPRRNTNDSLHGHIPLIRILLHIPQYMIPLRLYNVEYLRLSDLYPAGWRGEEGARICQIVIGSGGEAMVNREVDGGGKEDGDGPVVEFGVLTKNKQDCILGVSDINNDKQHDNVR